MKKTAIAFTIAATIGACLQTANAQQQAMRRMNPVDFSNVKIDDAFWSPRLDNHIENTVPVCIDQIENKTGRIQNFVNAAHHRGPHSGIFFDDSDVYKAIEGFAYTLQNHRDSRLEAKADDWIDKICAAQQPDGYLYTFYTINGLDKRWTDNDKHEMYCAGHLIEAAVAYKHATGKRKFLDTAIRFADYMMTVFGPGKRDWVPGHEEIELALVKLYDETGDKRYLDFSAWLIHERGRAEPRKAYDQSAVPVENLYSIGGHAVRAMYLFCGMADVAALTQNHAYMTALDSLWHDVVFRNMYVTGGIGSSKNNEGFTEDFDLPNREAYCETCASIGMVLWNWRMNLMTGDAKYVDVLERSMYNGVLAGMNIAGDRFFYVNPLSSAGDHHRQEWYGCACCPSNVCRFIPSIGNYIYAISNDALWVNLFISGNAAIPYGDNTINVSQHTAYPWKGDITLTLNSDMPTKELRIRIPAWAKSHTLTLNGKKISSKTDKGYAVVKKQLKRGDVLQLSLPMDIRMTAADPRVKADAGKRAVERGPIVYCIEAADNGEAMNGAHLDSHTTFTTEYEAPLLGSVQTIDAKNADSSKPLRLIPYFSWDNRTAGKMDVWIDYTE